MITENQYQRAKNIIKKYENSHSADFDRIKEITARQYGHTPDEITVKTRKADICEPRQIAMFLANRYLHQKTTSIGENLGYFDHTTVLHAVKRINNLYRFDKAFRNIMDKIGSELAINIEGLIN